MNALRRGEIELRGDLNPVEARVYLSYTEPSNCSYLRIVHIPGGYEVLPRAFGTGLPPTRAQMEDPLLNAKIMEAEQLLSHLDQSAPDGALAFRV